MKKALVLYVDDGVSDESLVSGGSFVPDILKERLVVSGITDGLVYSVPSSYQGALSSSADTLVRDGDDIACWKAIAVKTGADHLVRVFADAPFIDGTIVSEMLEIHEKYLAEFTYSENIPSGLSCEIFSSELIRNLPDDGEKRLPLSQVIRSNINQFDVELFYKAPDIRDKRIFFRGKDARERRIMDDLSARLGRYPAYVDLKNLIEEHCDLLYSGPSYLEIEVSGTADVEAVYSWRKGIKTIRGDMSFAFFSKLIGDMRQFGLPYSICFGGSGDPLCNSSFYEMLEAARAENLIKTIFIETDGTRCDSNFTGYLSRVHDPRITVIIDCSAYDDASYAAMYNSDKFQTVKKGILAVRDALGDNAKNLYIQLMKIRETEPFIDAYYDFWEAEKVQIILQKQNTFLGVIEDRRYYDLTPLDRIPCWHLQRDLFVMSDGKVGFCKQDINGVWSKWNIGDSPLSDIWVARKDTFLNDCKGKRSVSPDCSVCDEWYTFNM